MRGLDFSGLLTVERTIAKSSAFAQFITGWGMAALAYRRFPTYPFYFYLLVVLPLSLAALLLVPVLRLNPFISSNGLLWADALQWTAFVGGLLLLVTSTALGVSNTTRSRAFLPPPIAFQVLAWLITTAATAALIVLKILQGSPAPELDLMPAPNPILVPNIHACLVSISILWEMRRGKRAHAWLFVAIGIIIASGIIGALFQTYTLASILVSIALGVGFASLTIAFCFLAFTPRTRGAVTDALASSCITVIVLAYVSHSPLALLALAGFFLSALSITVILFDTFDLRYLRWGKGRQ